ncbi:MAG TPA: DUF1629 domain-containing protein [Candidatus Angelobacter sp.]|nr:DUF1629 domain-containing protein [Candidatus Angelobacter sp.]
MRWYWAISWGKTVSNPFVSSAEDLKGYEDWQLERGHHIEHWDPTAWIRCTKPEWDGEPDDVLQTHLAIPIYSPRWQEVIRNARFSGIQFLPIRVLHMNGGEIPGFAIANILNIPFAMDLERSHYTMFDDDDCEPEDRGKVSGVYRMVLRRSPLSNYDVIRVKEFHQSLYVSERFKLEFEAAKFTGYTFQEVQLTDEGH